MKPKVAVFDFTGCEGCELAILECEPELVDILGAVDIVEWREAATLPHAEEIDIAFVDGAITTNSGVERIKEIRARTKVLIPIGSCACLGGLNAMKNRFGMDEVRRIVYGDKGQDVDTIPARPVSAVVPVDFELPGCPMDRNEFLEATKALLLGKTPSLPNYAVCVECKLNENVCLFDKGEVCMGPITRAGCNAICPNFGDACVGCRGFLDKPNDQVHHEVLEKHGLTVDEIKLKYDLFNAFRPEQAGS